MLRPAAAFSAVLALAGTAPLHGQEPAAPTAADLAAFVDGELRDLVALYQELHQHPELSFHERDTAARLAAQLEAAGCQVTRSVGGTGIVAVLQNGAGRVGMLRTDLDALPIAEATGLPFASTVRAPAAGGGEIGVMHACGHDLHMTNLVGTARWFARHRDAWHGTLLLVGQPAEERAGGAKAMLAAGLFERFAKPAFALALHCEPLLPAGTVGLRAGPMMAAVDSVDVTLFGRGGHGAAPHRTIDPIVLAAQYVLALQTIVSRETNPLDPAVVTVGSIHAGSKHNVIPDRCELQLSVRSYDDGVRAHLHDAIVQKAKGLAMAAGAPEPQVVFSEPLGPLRNDAAVTATATAAMRAMLGEQNVVEMRPQMIAEDFGEYGAAGVPICMFRLGTTAAERLQRLAASGGPPALHSDGYCPDVEPSLRAGIPATVAALCALLH